MSEIADYVQVIYGLSKASKSHQIGSKTQVITFFALRGVEIPTTIYLPYDAVVQRLQVSVLATKDLQIALWENLGDKYINATTAME